MQRVHMDDMTGFLTEQSDEWECSTACHCRARSNFPCWGGKPYHRKAGEVLSPEREPLYVLDARKRKSAATPSLLNISKCRCRQVAP